MTALTGGEAEAPSEISRVLQEDAMCLSRMETSSASPLLGGKGEDENEEEAADRC